MAKLTRRHVIRLIAAIAAIDPARVWADETIVALPAPRRALLVEVCDIVFPATDTQGAVAAGVPDFVAKALAVHMAPSDTSAPGGLALLGWLEAKLPHDFLQAAPARRLAMMSAFDAAEYTKRDSAWVALKSLIVMAYYTSETGGARELQYNLVPGRFDPDVPLRPGDRAYSSDWTAVTYG